MKRQADLERIAAIVGKLEESYADRIGVNLSGEEMIPRRDEIISVTEKLLEIIFPGYQRKFETAGPAALLLEIQSELANQICRAMRRVHKNSECDCNACALDSCGHSVYSLLEKLPEIREITKLDVAAAYAGDPAAYDYDEIILSYPGLKAITIQRLAHVLYLEKVPLIPRMMTEYAHTQTGIDIHPGAEIGKGVFIDHGTGVVVGETARIGDNVRIYQGVTLGAVHFPKDACGLLIKGNRRHPTIGNNVTIYSGASVLGDIVIGDDSVIGGNVWLTESLPAGTKITATPPDLRRKQVNK